MQRKGDGASALGLALAIGVIAVVHALNGGKLAQIVQPGAFAIVSLGTLAVLLATFRRAEVSGALRAVGQVYGGAPVNAAAIDLLIELAQTVRRDGLLALETHKATASDPLVRKMIQLLMDGADATTLREILEGEIASERRRSESAVRVLGAAAEAAPTIGVLGAVLGLIPVLAEAGDPARLATGAVLAFASVLYGLFFANVLFEPWSKKLAALSEARVRAKEAVRVGVLGIHEGVSPLILKERLDGFVDA